MASLVFALYLTCLSLGNEAQTPAPKSPSSPSVHQESGLVSVKTGDNLTLPCFSKGEYPTRFYWYKQTLGQKPRLVTSYYMFDRNGTFYNEFKNDPRFALYTEDGKNHLTITDLHISDSATYYCASTLMFIFEFAEGILVNVEGSGVNIPIVIHQSTSESIQTGGSVTLNCIVQTGTCEGEHSVYWFKNVEEPRPGLIYSREGGNGSCERKSGTQTHTCVYNMPMTSLNSSHAGTYYCAVASCGHILFGNGTKLEMDVNLVYFWRGASAFTSILVVLLAFSLCIMKKRSNCQSSETRARCSSPSTANPDGYQEAETLCYAALSSNLPERSGDRTWSKCLYYTVKK